MRSCIVGRPHWSACAAAAVAAALGIVQQASAYDPTPTLRNLSNAPYAVMTILEVAPGQEQRFLDTMVREGAYSKLASGFANERILKPLPTSEGHAMYFCIARYFDKGTADYVEEGRLAALKPLLARAPVRIDATLVEHLLANWSWERGTEPATVTAKAFQDNSIFEESISSLSFFKTGYVGQVGRLEIFPKTAEVERIRSAVSQKVGLSGASIFRESNGERFLVYSEFFKAPANSDRESFMLTGSRDIAGAQAGVVVQNYASR